MGKYLVGIFDQFRLATNALSQLRDRHNLDTVSFISRDVPNPDVNDFLVDEEHTSGMTDYYEIGSATSALISISENYHTIPFTDIGNLVLSGPFSDLLEISYANGDEEKVGFSEAMEDIGFTNGLNSRYSDLVKEGKILLFVPTHNHSSENIIQTLQDYGVLETEEIDLST